PVGSAKLQCVGEMRQGQWVHKYCRLNPEGVSVCFQHFQYPIDRLTGFVDYDDLQKLSKFDAVGYSGDRPITLRGYWKGSGEQADAVIDIAGDDIPLDRKLLDALYASTPFGKQAESFHPVGHGHFRGRVCRVPGNKDYVSTY